MSFARLVRRIGHLDDDRLLALAATQSDHRHLRACTECAARLAELSVWLDAVRSDVLDATDAVFTSDRLATQRAQILRRLEHAGRPAKIINFPARTRPIPGVRTSGRRWIAAAAVGGLLVGLFAGRFLDNGAADRLSSYGAARSIARQAPSNRVAAVRPDASVKFTDEDFLMELETAADKPSVAELRAIDAYTPRVREIALAVDR